MLDIAKYKENIIDGMKYILEREVDITDEVLESEEGCVLAEELDRIYKLTFKNRYLIVINNIILYIDGAMSKNEAQFVLSNIENITYLYCEQDEWDSELGNLTIILNEYKINDLQYKRAIEKLVKHNSCITLQNLREMLDID